MKEQMLIPFALRDKLPALYETEGQADPICHIKLFTPDSNWTWYVIVFSKANQDICYGYVQGLENELGYFSLDELQSIKGSLGLSVERDIYFSPTKLSTLMQRNNL